jgi:hypothetical protein
VEQTHAKSRYGGYSRIDDSWYHTAENFSDTSLCELKCGAYGIGIARSKKTIETYKNRHKKLRVMYAENQLAKEIAAKYQELNDTAQEIRQRLQESLRRSHHGFPAICCGRWETDFGLVD